MVGKPPKPHGLPQVSLQTKLSFHGHPQFQTHTNLRHVSSHGCKAVLVHGRKEVLDLLHPLFFPQFTLEVPCFMKKLLGGMSPTKTVASVPWRVVRRPKKIKDPTFGHHLLGNPNPQAAQHQPMRHEVDMLPGCLSISFCIALVQNHDLATGSSVIWTWAFACRTLDGCAAPVP